MWNKNAAVPVAKTCVMGLSCILAMLYFGGFYGYDDWQYSSFLRALRYDEEIRPTLGGARWLVSLPYAAYAQLFGLDPYWAVSLHSLEYLALVWIAMALAGLVASPAASIAAGLLLATCPIILLYSGALLPDNIVTLLFLLQFIVFLRFMKFPDEKKALRLAATAGFLHALLYMTKEPSVLFGVGFIVIAVVSYQRSKAVMLRTVLAVFIGFSAGILIDLALGWLVFGDPIVRLSLGGSDHVTNSALNRMVQQGTYPLERLATAALGISSQWQIFGVGFGYPILLAAIASPALLLIRAFRRTEVVILSLTALLIVVYHTFGSLSLTQYVGIWLNPRYYAPAAALVILLFVIIADIAIKHIGSEAVRRVVGSALIFAVLTFSAASVIGSLSQADQVFHMRVVDEVYSAAAHFAVTEPEFPVYAGKFVTQRIVRFGPVANLRGFDEAKRDLRRGQQMIIILYTAEKSFEEAGIPLPNGIIATALGPADHGLLMWKNKISGVADVLGKRNADNQAPLRFIKFFRLQKAD